MMMIFVLNCKTKAFLAFEFIQASTFNPLGSSSSTDNKTNKNENLQKVKVRKKVVIKITNSGQVFPTIAIKFKASCQAPLTTTKC